MPKTSAFRRAEFGANKELTRSLRSKEPEGDGAIIRLMATQSHDVSTDRLPLVAVGYGPRCVPVMQLTAAAAGLCELLWMIDGSMPEMREMTELLNRFGPVVDIAGLSVDQILKELSPPYQARRDRHVPGREYGDVRRGGRGARSSLPLRPRHPSP